MSLLNSTKRFSLMEEQEKEQAIRKCKSNMYDITHPSEFQPKDGDVVFMQNKYGHQRIGIFKRKELLAEKQEIPLSGKESRYFLSYQYYVMLLLSDCSLRFETDWDFPTRLATNEEKNALYNMLDDVKDYLKEKGKWMDVFERR